MCTMTLLMIGGMYFNICNIQVLKPVSNDRCGIVMITNYGSDTVDMSCAAVAVMIGRKK